ncbi:MAG: MOSC domain-containing protein [Acidobacteria bacterium]|nr:MOSC domain-containing protein [Acidobacteriota bacterium]
MTELGTVAAIFRYPVKSMLGESIESAEVRDTGIAGDRVWAVRDESRGNFMTGKRVGALMGCIGRSPESGSGVPDIELPTGEAFRADDPAAGRRLSEYLGHRVTLWPCGSPPVERAPAAGPAELEAILARAPGEPLPDLSTIPKDLLEFGGRPVKPFVDLAPLMLLTSESIAAMQRSAPEATIDVRRFRPSVMIDAPARSRFPEQDWIGRRVRVGDSVWQVRMTCPRCVMTTHGFAGLPQDSTVMRRLVSEAGGNLGVYASVERPGRIHVGDAVEALRESAP